jgi:hypothetical protein
LRFTSWTLLENQEQGKLNDTIGIIRAGHARHASGLLFAKSAAA